MGDQLEFHWNDNSGAVPTIHLLPRNPPEQQDAERHSLFEGVLATASGVPVRLTITNNRSTMLSYRRLPSGVVSVRAHRNFLRGAMEVWISVGKWIKNPRARKAAGIVDAFIRENRPEEEPGLRPSLRCSTNGRVHDLRRLFDEVNREHFDGGITAVITWGLAPRRYRRSNIRLGSYSPGEDLIRIHPHLDQHFVPEFFIRYIVFHEMLHAHIGIENGPNGRRKIHTREFRQAEEAYPDFKRAESWINDPENIRRVLRTRRAV